MSATPTSPIIPFPAHIPAHRRARILTQVRAHLHDAAPTEDARANALATLIELEPDDMVRNIYVEQANRILWSAAHG